MPRPRRVTGPAKENWWKSSDIDEQRNQLQQDQWNKIFNERLSDFNDTRKAQQRSQQAVRNFSKPNTSSERQSITRSERQSMDRTDLKKTEQQRKSQWEDEFKKRSQKRR